MASYFDEHDCLPLANGEAPNHLLHLARLLRDGGYMEEFEELFGRAQTAPPTAKSTVEKLPDVKLTVEQVKQGSMCSVCRADFTTTDEAKQLPCQHKFHSACILPWLLKTNTCPECRYELPTDDEAYEASKQWKARQVQRDHDLETLHSSMFG